MRFLNFFIGLVLILLTSLFVPRVWYPEAVQKQLYQWVGTPSYRELPQTEIVNRAPLPPELQPCSGAKPEWRKKQVIEGIDIAPSPVCLADNPYLVAAAVKGTNRVSHMTLMESRLTPDAVVKGRDLDGDGDPDEIHIRLEVIELNGSSPDVPANVTTFPIAPGVEPGFWVFAPKGFGMSTKSFESFEANDILRAPSPAIRVEQGDKVKLTLENSHYMPHTIHLHGVDHPYLTADGQGNDGVPQTGEIPVFPGKQRTYEFTPRQPGTMFYHCHVQPAMHILMGLQGMFIIEENRPNNMVQTLNIGAGFVRHSSAAVKESFAREYDLHYQDIDYGMNNLIQKYNDPRNIIKAVHRDYDITDGSADYYLLNGRSFPYTWEEALIVAAPNTHTKMRVVNGGGHGVALHTHGHKVKVTHLDGVAREPAQQEQRDVVWIAPAQRVDLDLYTLNDGLHSYGEGIWFMHDHKEVGVTTNGIGPGGNVSAIVYDSFMDENGLPKTQGVDLTQYFYPEFYARRMPIWESYDPIGIFGDPEYSHVAKLRFVLIGLFFGLGFLLIRSSWRG